MSHSFQRKLAASPVVVVLCGMSVGAGFSTRENVSYIGRIKGQVESTRNLLPAVGRLIAAVLHISLTGTCAFFLAVSLFKGKAYRWAKYLGWALMVVAHGSFDAFLTFNQAVPLHECYFRATCDQTTRKCTIDKKGMLRLSCIMSPDVPNSPLHEPISESVDTCRILQE